LAEPTTATVDAPAAPPAGQDAVGAEIARLEASIPQLQRNGTAPQAPSPAAPAPPPSEPAAPPTQPTPPEGVLEPGGPEDTDEGPEPTVESGQARPGRTKRLAQQLTAAENDARAARELLQQRQAQEADALRQFVDLVLPDAQFEQLRQQAEGGDWEAKQRLDTARTWRRMAAPIADLAHHAVAQQMDATLDELRTRHAWERETLDQLKAAPPPQRLALIYDLARKASDEAHTERIRALETEVQSLKTTRAANGTQPASGGAPAAGTPGLSGLVGRNGLLTDEALNLSPAEIRARFGRV
jgi:hypothetical protein